ncbi:MAG: formyl transferase [Bacteroidota bacterium]
MKVILLASSGASTNILYNKINAHYEITSVIIEDNISAKVFWERRIKKLGLWKVLGQVLFIVIIQKILKMTSKARSISILKENGLSTECIPENKLLRVNSVNSEKLIGLLKQANPDLILVNGTRIISKKVLSATQAPFINIHAGITPEYRGVHGAYWAFYNKEPDLAGVTLHFVDKGVDTGNIIDQQKITVSKKDNFATYSLLQLSAGINLLMNYLDNKKEKKQNIPHILSKGKSNQWYHPGFFQYIFHRLMFKVK